MKKNLFLLIAGILFSLAGFSQGKIGTNNQGTQIRKCWDVAVGYVPDRDFQALRVSTAFNNIVFKRFGVFTAFEVNGNNDYYSHILGITGSITNFLYVYGGADLFTKNGLFTAGSDCRKNIGIGIYPISWGVVKFGYSQSVGVTAEVGLCFPLGK